MATQDNNRGLLSKVARFVLNPTKDWGDVDKPEVPQEVDHGKEALKLVIQRKRHDDAVRRREFSQLRKLRQASPSMKAELTQGVSSFRTTSGDLDAGSDERATTLKKIDEIEAQMARQWWKGRSGAVPLAQAGSPQPMPARQAAGVRPPERPDTFPSTLRTQLTSSTQDSPTLGGATNNFDFQPTERGDAPPCQSFSDDEMLARSAFSPSKMVLIDMGQNLSDPELEEAAIRYANGDDAGAQAVLQAALMLPDATFETAESWASALLDLYRSTGQHDEFVRVAQAYAHRFGRPATSWSLAPPQTSGQQWVCPAVLDEVAVAQLRDVVGAGGAVRPLNWRALQQMSEAAARNLAALVARWCETPLTLSFVGEESLVRVLRTLTPSNDRSVLKHLWQLRFDVLRLLQQQDDYELAALEFCVTFEVSPPPWRAPSCQCVSGAEAQALAEQDRRGAWHGATGLASVAPVAPKADRHFALSGEVLGDVSAIVGGWQLDEDDADSWSVSCAQLIRVDFSAAGGLLNWVAHMTAAGKRVEFHDVPRLVAAFFNLIGINEHARITARTN